MLSKTELHYALDDARANTDTLFQIVHPAALYERPIPERHRIIFYLGHLEAFDWNLLSGPLEMSPFNKTFDRLFAFGIDPSVGSTPSDQASDWPSVEQVVAYNREVRGCLDRAIERAPEHLLNVAVEHRLMHAETFAYILHNLPLESKVAGPVPQPGPESACTRQMMDIPAGHVSLGRNRWEGFGWDNEFSQHTIEVPAFSISKHKITNGDYVKFVRSGGPAPHLWVQRGSEWRYRTFFGEIALPITWPVYVTQQQAAAYASWAGKRLPTEAELQRASYGTPDGQEREYPWGDIQPDAVHGNFDFAHWDPVPVTATPEGDSAFGVSQLVGNGWEWTATAFAPFPGFEPFPFYPGYSADFFDGAHYVLKGGSPRTAGRLLRRSFRNWFRPDYPYAYAGFRLAES